ncbi:hypothetical protein QBC46DRAFT_278287 [Diplogelasinospora grovesii]|uniref:FAD/NAD(P)-binding domain-containing protein n=1 Tax=Diplogelasinospora grovesii TaxID=303347 RepID=A0AAN6NFV3_9PEZI|nr:hypothetical protein QBC46DRAFT_278287 [Diplogelasinospora grovesii]
MTRTIVVLGANYTGIPVAHYLLKRLAPKVEGGLKVILVSPNTHFYWHNAAVRAILPGMMEDEKVLLPIAPAFAKYPADQFEFIVGKAEQVNPKSRSVIVAKNDGASRTVNYDELVIATGSTFKEDMPFKLLSSTEETKKALDTWRKRIDGAKSIVVAGAGATGVEVAGELGEEYAVTGKKEITVIVDKDLPFATKYLTGTREAAKKELEKLKVKVITNTKVTRVLDGCRLELTSTDGKKQTIKADLFMPTFGVTSNTSFLPREMLDRNGFVKQTTFLRAEGHDNIFVVGDAGNLQEPQGKTADEQVVHLAKVIEAYVLGKQLPEYKPAEGIVFGASIGRNRGTGQMGNWRLWSLMIYWFKCRYLGTEYAQDFLNGTRSLTAKEW